MIAPDTIVLLMVPLGFAVVIAVFVIVLRRKKKLHPLETGHTPLIEDTSGGGLIGSMRSTYPFVRISVYKDFLVVGSMAGPILLRYDEIVSADIGKVYFTRGLVIIHRSGNAPKRIIIWSQRLQEIHNVIAGQMGKISS